MTDKAELFSTCGSCVVKEWCKLRKGEIKLPSDYIQSFCVGYEKLTKALELARIPKEYRTANLFHYVTDSDNMEFADIIKKLLTNPVGFVTSGTNLALINKGKGTGKSWTATAVLNEFIYKTCRDPEWFDFENPVALYVKFGAWANRQRDIYTRNDEQFTYEAHKELNQMKDVPLLVLDDIGSGRITPIIRDLIYDVIDYRKEEQKSTIFTSNYPDSLLKNEDMLGEMVVSRMLYNTMVIPLGGRDRRAGNIYNY
ncbi:putative DNA replication protein [Brevibacillus phage SecTim467]|uniref:Putative DNA replication protein n=2 Tax=Jenstvirus jenst TaxID=1982225 RepID=A0A0K2CNX1_9CAUD|nr:DnaC-like helicase loader [Brevibacillus phage Jenst]ALA07275.1 putative DNA replication protein [Brevibacillus phage Jenst]ALA07476.1 putative DNA replication protein [Brevibacillus phage SecTim467]